MTSSRFDPEPEWDPEPGWRPDPPWEPDPESNPWSHRDPADDDLDAGLPPALAGAVARDEPSYAVAYLAAAAVLVVSFGLGVVTVGLHARVGLAGTFLAVGAAVVASGLVMLGLAVWFTGGLERR